MNSTLSIIKFEVESLLLSINAQVLKCKFEMFVGKHLFKYIQI